MQSLITVSMFPCSSVHIILLWLSSQLMSVIHITSLYIDAGLNNMSSGFASIGHGIPGGETYGPSGPGGQERSGPLSTVC